MQWKIRDGEFKIKIKENKEIQKRYTDLEEDDKRKEKERRGYLEEERNDLRRRRALLLVTKRIREKEVGVSIDVRPTRIYRTLDPNWVTCLTGGLCILSLENLSWEISLGGGTHVKYEFVSVVNCREKLL